MPERVWCVATLTESASIKVEITVYGEADEGCGSRTTARLQRMCQGTATPQIPWIRNGYPSGDGAGSPNGQPISDVFSRVKFFVGNQARLRGGNHPPDPKLDSIRLTSLKSFQDRMNPICLCL